MTPSRFALARRQAQHVLETKLAEARDLSLMHAAVGSVGALTALGIMGSGGRADVAGVATLGLIAGVTYATVQHQGDKRDGTPRPSLLRAMGRGALATALMMNAGNGVVRLVAGEPAVSSFQTQDAIHLSVIRDEDRTPGRALGVTIEAPNGPEGTAQKLIVLQDRPGEIGLSLPTGETVLIVRDADGTLKLHQQAPTPRQSQRAAPAPLDPPTLTAASRLR